MKTPRVLRQFGAFLLVGGIATLAQYVVLVVLVQVFQVAALTASLCGYGVGALLSYGLNYSLTFASDRAHRDALWRFAIIVAAGFAMNGLLMQFGVSWLQLHYLAAQVMATAIVLIWNFLANRMWTFASNDEEAST